MAQPGDVAWRLDRSGAAAMLAACSSTQSGSGKSSSTQGRVHLPPIAERGHEPWVFRSVLDRRPRMVTFALSRSMWAAYDTQHASLYKVWRDGVEFDGAVYTTRHGPQPAAEGAGYIVSTIQNPWAIVVDGRERPASAQYLDIDSKRPRGDPLRADDGNMRAWK